MNQGHQSPGQQVFRKWNGLLSLVLMRGAGDQLQLVEHVPGQRVLGKHPLDSQMQDFVWLLGPQVQGLDGPLTAWPAGKPDVTLLCHLRGVVIMVLVDHFTTREANLVRVQHDDVIASVDVRSVFGFVLAHQDCGKLGRQSPDDHPFGINNEPLGSVCPTLSAICRFDK